MAAQHSPRMAENSAALALVAHPDFLGGADGGGGSSGGGGKLQPPGDQAMPDVFGDEGVFSTRRPKNVGAGVSSGLKSLGKGVAGGVATLLAAPAMGAARDGTKGFFTGLAQGLAGAVCFPVIGAGVAVVQVGRGICNTPEAIMESTAGKRWDEGQRVWVEENLEREAALLKGLPTDDEDIYQTIIARRGGGGGEARGGGDVADLAFYEMLGVPPTATASEIKRQYYLKARQMHPDKNPGDAKANERFQALGEAYQVLSDPELRAKYDSRGKEGVEEVNFVEPAAIFAMLFGSERFQHLVGTLALAVAARAGMEVTREEMAALQSRREARLAVYLAALLRRWVEGDHEGFVHAMETEAAMLAKASFGETMLHTVGFVYQNRAETHLSDPLQTGNWEGLGMQSGLSVLKAKYHSASVHVEAAKKALSAFNTGKALMKEESELRNQAAAEKEKGEGKNEGTPDGAGPSSSAGAAKGAAKCKGKDGSCGAGGAGGEVQEDPRGQQMARVQEAMPVFLEALWAANVLDIEKTLQVVVGMVLHDKSVDDKASLARAEGLKRLGQIFQAARAPEGEKGEAMQVIETAIMGAAMKAREKEDAMHAEGP